MCFSQGKSNIIKNTSQKHLNKLHDKVGDAGVVPGLFYEGHKNNKDNNCIYDNDDADD